MCTEYLLELYFDCTVNEFFIFLIIEFKFVREVNKVKQTKTNLHLL